MAPRKRAMPQNSYKELPVETLHELLVIAIGELLEAMDKKDEVSIKAKKKHVEMLYFDIFDKKSVYMPVNTKKEQTAQ